MEPETAALKAVLDTNILGSATFWLGKPHQIVELAIGRKIEVYTSLEILEELERVLRRDFLEDQEFVEDQIALILEYATVVEPRQRIRAVADDPEDDKIIECAVAAGADYIVTGDPHILNLGCFGSVVMVTPAAFIDRLRKK